MATTTPPNGSSAAAAAAKPAAVDALKVKLPPIPSPVPLPSSDALASGLHGAIGCDFIPSANQLAFVEYDSGAVSVLNLIRPQASIVQQKTVVLKGTYILNLDTAVQGGSPSAGDIWWDQQTTTLRQMAAVGGAKIVNLGQVDYNTLTSAGLQALAYAGTPITGNDDTSNKLVNGDVFAVLTNAGNYAKVQVLSYGYDMEIQWVSYKVGAAYQVLGTGYANPESIVVQSDGRHAFVSERSGDIVHISLQSAARSAATVVTSGLKAPQQITLNAAENVLYAVEYASPGRLLAIDVTTNNVKTIASALENAVGVALSADGTSAYVSEQPTSGGRVREVNLQTGAITDVASGFTAPFMLAFLDPTRERLAVVERDPANRIAVIDLSNGNTVTRPNVTLGFRPSALAPLAGGDALVTCDTQIDEVSLGLSTVSGGPLLKGIGFVPYDRITTAGLADTSVDPTYFFQVKNAPFGGTLPIMIDHAEAWNDGASYYSVLVDGAARSDSWTDYLWDATTNAYVLQTITPTVVAGHTVYPVRNPATLELWYNTDLASQANTTGYPDGVHTLQITFYNAVGGTVASSTSVSVRFENSPCSATLTLPHINGVSANACGVLNYTAPTNVVTLAFTASQPHNFATYSFELERGVTALTPPSQSGVAPAAVTLSPTVAQIIGPCTIAGYAEYLYVAATAINGEARQSQYDASASQAFVLAS